MSKPIDLDRLYTLRDKCNNKTITKKEEKELNELNQQLRINNWYDRNKEESCCGRN